MSDDPPNNKTLAETHPHLREFFDFLPAFNKESDRGMILIGCNFIDELLRRTLEGYFVENAAAKALLDGFNAPLGSFSSRIAACFALGLISEAEYNDCQILRKIRNRFAHDFRASFSDPSAVDAAKNLRYSAKDYGYVKVDTRGSYASAASSLMLNLVNRPAYVSRERRQWKEWKY